MFNVGGGELIFIFLLALIVLGPDKLPNAARQAGKYLSEFRRMSQGFQQELKDAMDIPELNDLKSTLTGAMTVPSTSAPASTPAASGPTRTPEGVPIPSDPAAGSEPPVVKLDGPPPTDAPPARPASAPSATGIVVEGPSGSFS